MNYEFHVGDYAAYSTNDRTYTGYVKKYMHPVFSNEYCFVFQWDDGKQLGWSGCIEELPHNFVRIGAYDFTKKEKKIKNLPCVTSTIDYGSNSWLVDKVVEARNKINELVDAVNKLIDKEDTE